jgi:polysaccharide export outer membrane protein
VTGARGAARFRRTVCLSLALGLALQGLPAAMAAATVLESTTPVMPREAKTAADLPTTVEHFQYPPFLIGPGDLLTVNVFGEHDLPTSFLVDSAGTIVFPPIGAVDLGGLTQVEASQVLTAALAKYIKDPMVTVLVSESSQYTVSVIGNVQKPGKYLIRGLPTLLGAVAEAGGPMPNSALNSTVLVRGNRTYELELGHFLDTGRGSQPQPVLLPGDIIYVPASRWPTLGDWGIIVSILTSVAVLYELARPNSNNP